MFVTTTQYDKHNLIVILSFLFHSCSSEEVDKCDKEIITFLPAVSVSTRSTMERGFEEGDKIGIFLFDQNKAAKWKYGSECWVSNIPVENFLKYTLLT